MAVHQVAGASGRGIVGLRGVDPPCGILTP